MDLTDDEDVLETSGEDVACGILDVHDVEGALVTLPKIKISFINKPQGAVFCLY